MPPEDHPLPAILRGLDADLVARWSVGDDVERGDAIETASTPELERLVAAVSRPVLVAIDAYLDSFEGHEPEDVVWLHDVAQASLEATFELQRRRAAPS
jgi:hypothetical protein